MTSLIYDPIIISTVTSLCYLWAFLLQCFRIVRRKTDKLWLLQCVLLVAISLHSYLLYKWIDVGIGQNLSFYNIFSLVTWLIALIIGLAIWKKPFDALLILICPLAVFSIGLVDYFPTQTIINTQANPFALWHILLSTIVVSVLTIAALQAIILAIQEKQLRHHPGGLIRHLPSLQAMEQLLFQVIMAGFVLLTVLLASSVILFYPLDNIVLIRKMVVSVCAWLIFLMLMVGRYYAGWRGKIAIQWTLLGVLALLLV